MFKRLFWLTMGAGFGFGASFWVMRFVRSTVDRYSPERVSRDMSTAVKRLGTDLKAAVADGREAMHDVERELLLKMESNGHDHAGISPSAE